MNLDFQDGDKFYIWENHVKSRLLYKINEDGLFYFDVINKGWKDSMYSKSDISCHSYFVDTKFQQIPVFELVLMSMNDFYKKKLD